MKLKDLNKKLKKKYGFVTERIIKGERVQLYRNIDDPKDEIQVFKEKKKDKILKLKIKEEKWRQRIS